MPVELVNQGRVEITNDGATGLPDAKDVIDQSRNGQRQDRVHVVPEPEQTQDPIRPAIALGEAIAEAVEEGVEVVVMNDEQPPARMAVVVMLDVAGELQPEGRFGGPFFAEEDRSSRLRRITKHLVPRRVVGAFD